MNLTVKQVAERLGIAPSTAYQLLRENRIAHLRVGGRGGAIRVPEKALEECTRSSFVDAVPSGFDELDGE